MYSRTMIYLNEFKYSGRFLIQKSICEVYVFALMLFLQFYFPTYDMPQCARGAAAQTIHKLKIIE